MAELYVNLDHVATVRQARGTAYPDVTEAAKLAHASGFVRGITLHLRDDRRHVQDSDVERVCREVHLPFNFELGATPSIVAFCASLHPAQATLVPEKREERTTEGGLDLSRGLSRVRDVVSELQAAGTKVSLFIEPEHHTLDLVPKTGAREVELHTGRYALASTPEQRERELAALRGAARHAQELGLKVHVGHGLTLENVAPVAAIPGLHELNIGHSIVARALFVGLREALREMHEAIQAAARP